MSVIGIQAFDFSLDDTALRLNNFLGREKYFVFVARDVASSPIGFVALYESHALYAEGDFGTISEFYVRLAYRSLGYGATLAEQAKYFGRTRGWKRLEVTTPPLPQFDKTLEFYQREGFIITGWPQVEAVL
ncbi:MAG: GNAT family N-acetyltransferase [Methylococcaceae bacterium]